MAWADTRVLMRLDGDADNDATAAGGGTSADSAAAGDAVAPT